MFNDFFKNMFSGDKEEKSKNVAKQRLKMALVYDKVGISEDLLRNLQKDMIAVVSKYFEIDKKALQLNIQNIDNLSALTFNTPILSSKRPDYSSQTFL